MQDRLAAILGRPLAGWFLGCTNPEIQCKLGLDGPYWARLFADVVHASPARLEVPVGLSAVLEVEFAFRLARDLPARSAPYTEHEVADAIATLHPCIEVVISYFRDWTEQPIASLITDNGTDGALIVGAGIAEWKGFDLDNIATGLSVNGILVRTGTGASVHGPLRQMAWLVNARSRRGDGLRAGHICNTGSTTYMYFAQPGERAVAQFEGLGEVVLDLV